MAVPAQGAGIEYTCGWSKNALDDPISISLPLAVPPGACAGAGGLACPDRHRVLAALGAVGAGGGVP